MSQEQMPDSDKEHEERGENSTLDINRLATERRNEQLERSSPEKRIDSQEASREALEQARTSEADQTGSDNATERVGHRDRSPGKSERESEFGNIMNEVRGHMSPSSRAFSKFIHSPAVESTSEVVGSTVARPNAILAGGISAFVISLSVYLVARYYGYPLSGAEAIAAFAAGWIIGIVIDYLRVLITGKKF